MYKKLLFIAISFIISINSYAQIDSLTVAKFTNQTLGANVTFTPKLPTLKQIAGAPPAFYSYFWELGDGNYSREKNPEHSYSEKGKYKVRLWATNNYGIERPPATRPQEVNIDQASVDNDEIIKPVTDDIELVRNREPMPGEEMLFMLRYANSKQYVTNGKFYLFYNERKYKSPNFKFNEGRFYHGENWIENEGFTYTHKKNNTHTQLASSASIFAYQKQLNDSINRENLPATVAKAKEKYANYKQIRFNNMNPGEKRNIFFTLFTPPEMIKDTSAIISIRGIYVPDENYDNHKVKDMEMEIVTSHDPNKMSTSNTFINYRLARFKRIKYKIKFQNNGEGPARTIRLETDIPEMYDKKTLRVEKSYPKCPICPKEKEVRYSCLDTTFTKKQAIFTFKNIYLPGSEQKNVKEYDSTKGFVKYSLKFKKDLKKKKTRSRTAIIFDKNEPIITNYSTTRFLPGISVLGKAGYNYYPNRDNSSSWFTGVGISTYQAYRWYLQGEFLGSAHFFDSNTINEQRTFTEIREVEIIEPQRDPVIENRAFTIPQEITTNTEVERYIITVPVLLKYNINKFLALGAGVQGDITLWEKQKITRNTTTFEDLDKQEIRSEINSVFEEKKRFNDIYPSLLFDFTTGLVRIGPSVGVRYINSLDNENNYWQFYARWKF